jgi:hypothetical protein
MIKNEFVYYNGLKMESGDVCNVVDNPSAYNIAFLVIGVEGDKIFIKILFSGRHIMIRVKEMIQISSNIFRHSNLQLVMRYRECTKISNLLLDKVNLDFDYKIPNKIITAWTKD